MTSITIFQPVFALATWTALVLLLVPLRCIRASVRGEVAAADFALGESSAVPVAVSLPNRNYMNLLEAPVLFYVVCLVLYVTAAVSPGALALAWAYVALRLVHSAIHRTYNKVFHRFMVFGASNAVLVALWVTAGLALYARSGG